MLFGSYAAVGPEKPTVRLDNERGTTNNNNKKRKGRDNIHLTPIVSWIMEDFLRGWCSCCVQQWTAGYWWKWKWICRVNPQEIRTAADGGIVNWQLVAGFLFFFFLVNSRGWEVEMNEWLPSRRGWNDVISYLRASLAALAAPVPCN